MKDKKNISKRSIPTQSDLNWRKEFLLSIKQKSFDNEYQSAPLFERGNSKIGFSSEDYDIVLVWNLPAVLTCPSASEWCLTNCYNADERTEKFPLDLWYKNLLYFQQNKDELQGVMLHTLLQPEKRIAVRIHSSGDFFSEEYIDFWRGIISQTPNVRYWSYTRSWTDRALLNRLEKLKSLNNIQLFASWDNTMPEPPKGWRKSIVYDELTANPIGGIVCPEQNGSVPNCATCNYCITKKHGDIYFILH